MGKLGELLDDLPTDGDMVFFDNDRFCGILIRWSESGRGFGEYSISVNKDTGEFEIDTENDHPDMVKSTIDRIINENPECVKDMFYLMVDYGSIPILNQCDDRDECLRSVTLNGKAIYKEDWD